MGTYSIKIAEEFSYNNGKIVLKSLNSLEAEIMLKIVCI